jgi:ABC-2 type transport system permease protein
MRAELLRLRRWPALWVMVGAWLVLNLMFTYLFAYLAYRNGGSGFGGNGRTTAELLSALQPAGVPLATVQGTPMFGGAIMLTLGAVAAGSGYGWGTWKTSLTMGRGRSAVAGGVLTALGLVVVGVVLLTFAVDLAVSSALSIVEGASFALPGFGSIALGLGGGVLILAMWTLLGVALGVLARGPALAIGLGVVWVLAVENLLRGLASLASWLGPVVDVLPGTAAGSLAASLGAIPAGDGGTPGVVTNLPGPAAAVVLAAYLLVFTTVAALVIRRRDVV